jgi:hypothetical protein
MIKDRQTGSRNVVRSTFAFFWIVLGGLSGVYLFTLLTNPGALGRQVAPGETSISSEQAASAVGAAEVGKIESTLRELSQQIAEINTRLDPLEKAARPAGSLSEKASPSTPAPEPVTQPEPSAAQPNKPSVALAQPAEKPAEPAKPAQAPKATQVPALEPTPAAKPADVKPAEVKPAATPASSPPAPEEPAVAENESEPTPPPVTVSEVPDEPLTEVTPSPSLSGNLSASNSAATDSASSSSRSGSESTAPTPNTEIAALSPTTLPPAANDGSTRYGIEIGIVAKQDGLRPLWREFLTHHAALVAGLQPRRVLAPDKKWRLIAGPFANAAEANQACLLFKKAQKSCEATVFAGDSL